MQPSNQQASSQNTVRAHTDLKSQIDFMRSAIQECVISYPKGDRCINDNAAAAYCNNPAGVSDAGARNHYPLDPASTHYTNATPGPTATHLASDIRCPGNNGGENGNHDDHAPLFGGASGKFMPPKPDLFEDWQYYSGNDGVFIWTYTTKTDPFIISALTKLDEEFSECEADVITGGATVYLDSDDTYLCAANSICFRVRLLTTGSATWEGDTDTDESGC